MPTYLIKREIPITRQEGDTADVVFIVPEVLDMALYSVRFSVTNQLKKSKIFKSSENQNIIIGGQTLLIPLSSDDTKYHSGNYRWELELFNETEQITIGKGAFNIISEINR